MAEILISVAAKVAEYLAAPIVRPLGYLFNYRSNLDKLKEQVDKLDDARGRRQRDVEEADRQGDEIEPDVKKWLTSTEGIIQKAQKLIEDEKAGNTSCFNLKLRYQRSRQAKKQSGDIGKMQEENKFDRVSNRPPPKGIWSSRLRDCEALESRASILNEIMEALRDDDIRMIGVWGMGGVGKTTLANQVAKKAEEDKLFEKVVMALNISQIPDVTKIQGEIAGMLGLNFGQEEELGRADRIGKSLNKHKTVLVILDDIWEELNLAKIGIPYGDVHKGCKVLLTSREHAVFSEMGTQKNFHVQHLCEKEAWSLFENTAGDSVEKLELRPIALEVVKECEGLPVAIVTIAKALKGGSVAVWKNALEELKRSAPTNIRGVSKNVYSCLELSYNHLGGDEVKRLFLLCGMLGYGDISMDQLLKYGMGLDLFESVSSMEQITNKLVTLVKILKDSSLLLDVEDGYGYGYEDEWPGALFGYSDENKFVRMHDVVGDVARAIAAKDPHRFVVIKEALGLEEWRRKEEFRNYSRIYLRCKDLHELPERLVCPKLEFFVLNGDYSSLRIPDTFFEKSELLRVLGLSGMRLIPLPSSLGFLSNLRTLCVQNCTLQDIAVIGELKKLQVLSFAGCGIEGLPKEMMQLTDLRVLDLWDCYSLEVIPRNVISSLSRLEHLCLAQSPVEWGLEAFDSGESSNACLSELNNLPYLKNLWIEITDSYLLSKDLVFKKLTRYMISVGPEEEYVDYDRSPRMLNLCRVTKPRLVHCFSKLFKTVEDLVLTELEDTKHVLYELDRDGFLQLKRLHIDWCSGIQYIVNFMKGVPPRSAFPILEELEIDCLPNMDAVCYGPIPEGSFGKLRSLAVEHCERLKSFIALPMEQGRDPWVNRQMGSLDLTRDFIFTGKSATPFFNEQVAFPSLEDLDISNLDNVEKIWHNHEFIADSFGNLKRLSVRSCQKLRNVIPSNMLKRLQSLEILKIGGSNLVEEVFDLESIDSKESHDIPSLQLRELCLDHLKNLKCVWNKAPQGLLTYHNLKSVQVSHCPSLKIPFPGYVVRSLLQVKEVDMNSRRVKEIVAHEDMAKVVSMFLFPEVTSLTYSCLKELKCFYLGLHNLEWPMLERLEVESYESLEMLASELDKPVEQPIFLCDKVAFPNLEFLNLCLKLKEIQDLHVLFGALSNLKILIVENCPYLSSLFSPQFIRCLNNLKKLTVTNCDLLEELFDHGHVEHVEMQIEEVSLIDLPMLRYICNNSPRQVLCFKNLKLLQVKRCQRMTYLFSPSMVLGLVQLQRLCIEHCHKMKEIVTAEEGVTDKIIFPQITHVSLLKLPNLTSFYPSQSLEKIHMEDSNSALGVLFNEKVAFPNLEYLHVSWLDNVKKIWHNQLLGDSFSKLKKMEVENCNELQNLLTSNVLNWLPSLEFLKIDSCRKLKEVFDQEVINVQEDVTDTQLSQLVLDDLQQRSHMCNKVLGKYLCLQNLKVLDVHNCGSMKNIFSPDMALGLVRLEGTNEIIGQEDEAEEVIDKIEFPELTSLSLKSLPSLASFYPGSHTHRRVGPGDHGILTTVLFDEKVAFPSLKSLNISGLGRMQKIWHNKLIENSFRKLAKMEVECCDELQNCLPLFVLKSSSLQILRIANCGKLEEAFDLGGTDILDDVTETQLNELVLHYLPQLQYIWNRDPYGILTYENLELVEVHHCQVLKVQFPSPLPRDLSQLKKQLIRSHWTKDLREKDQGKDFVFPEVTYNELPEVTYNELELPDLRKIKGKEVVVVGGSDYVGEISGDMPGSSG